MKELIIRMRRITAMVTGGLTKVTVNIENKIRAGTINIKRVLSCTVIDLF